MMNHDKKLKFIHQMTKLGLDSIPHYDLGGTIGGAFNTFTTQPLQQIGSGLNLPGGGIQGALGLTNNFQAQGSPVAAGTNAGQLGTAYTGAQQGLNDQTGLVSQTQPGVAQGINSQTVLSNQLADEAAGKGPNPAQAALNQSTGQNIASQAALAAGTRGASANAGLIAENNAQQGAATQQQAVGQAATLQAQQQIAAQQAQQQLAATQVGQGQSAVQGENQTQQNEQNILQGANTAANNATVSQQSNANTTNASVAAGNQTAAGNVIGGLTSGLSSLAAAFADGGTVGAPKMMAGGGYMAPTPLTVAPVNGPQSFVGQWINSNVSNPGSPSSGGSAPSTVAQPSLSNAGSQLGTMAGNALQSGDSGDAGPGIAPMTTAGGAADANDAKKSSPLSSLAPLVLMAAAKGGDVRKMLPPMHGKNDQLISKGGNVKAEGKKEKAVSKKDSYANDKVPAMLSEGEVVMDKDTLNDPGPIGQMARTVAHHIAARNNKGRKSV